MSEGNGSARVLGFGLISILSITWKACSHAHIGNVSHVGDDALRLGRYASEESIDVAHRSPNTAVHRSADGSLQIENDALTYTDQVSKNNPLLDGERISKTYIRFDAKIDSATQTPIRRPQFISLVPENSEEFYSVYGRQPTAVQEVRMANIGSARSAISTRPPRSFDSISSFESYLTSFDATVVVIIAHSTDGGRRLHFPGGLEMGLRDFHESCVRVRKSCLTLTCNSRDFLYNGEISATEAFSILSSSRKWLSQNPDASVDDFVYYVRKTRYENNLQETTSLSWIYGGSISAGFTGVLSLSRTSRSEEK